MSRVLKFRAWNEDHMVYSDNITTEDVYFQFDNGTLKAYYIGDEYDLEAGGMVPTSHEIETPVMQFTGLKDKNGKEIYEGDILRLDSFDPSDYEVKFIDGAFCLCHKNIPYAHDIHYVHHAGNNQATIVGNIYENSELTEQRK